MSEAQIMDLTVACHSFPELAEPQIHRTNILDTIDDLFEGGTQVAIIEGPEGVGKTTLLAQFARRHPHNAFSLFIHPVSRIGCDAGVLRFDLCNQLQWALRQVEIKDPDIADVSFLHRCLLDLNRLARRKGGSYIFVVDGLGELPDEHTQVKDLILDLLPLGFANFRFLLSGEPGLILHRLRRQLTTKDYPLSRFGLDETAKYLQGLALDEQAVHEIHNTCRGMPGYLAGVRRLLSSGVDPTTLLHDLPAQMPDLFEVEWQRVQPDDDLEMMILGVLAHDRRTHTLDNLAGLLGTDADAVSARIRDLTFLSVDTKRNVAFVSDSFRRFAAQQLRALRTIVWDLLIARLAQEPESEEALEHLPVFYERASKLDELLDYLSPTNLSLIVQSCQSLVPVQQKAKMGLDAAHKLHRDGDLVRFSIQQATVHELDGAQVWRSEVEALTALGDYPAAMALAQTTVLKEDRLHLLAVIARAQRERGEWPEPELAESIALLCNETDLPALGDKAVDIAEDLIYSEPELAIRLLEESAGSNKSENKLDWALARLSLATLPAYDGTSGMSDVAESLRSRIRDPRVRFVTAAASVLSGERSAEQIIAEAEKVSGASNRLFLLRQWTVANREAADAAAVVDYALNVAIGTTEYSPNARVFCELAEPLASTTDPKVAAHLVARFDSQRAGIERLGPTDDYVRLQCLLAKSESNQGIETCRARLVDLYYYILGVSDLATKVSCMARLVATLTLIDAGQALDERDQLHAAARHDLQQDLQQLLSTTADQYHAVRSAVRALAKVEPEMAFELATSLNTERRRDRALRDLVESIAATSLAVPQLEFLERTINTIVDGTLRDAAVLRLVERLPVLRCSLPPEGDTVPRLVKLVASIRDAAERCRGCCLVYRAVTAYDSCNSTGLTSFLSTQLQSTWDSIDVGWVRVDVGFRIAAALSECAKPLAREYLAAATSLKSQIALESEAAASAYILPTRLAVRALKGLLRWRVDTPEDIDRLARLIDRIPSNGERARIWSDVALCFHAGRRSDECRQIVTQRVKPILQCIVRRKPITESD